MKMLFIFAMLTLTLASAFAQADGGPQPGFKIGWRDPSEAPTSSEPVCANRDANTVDLLQVRWLSSNCLTLRGGFSSVSGTFAGLSYSTRNFLHLGETTSLNAEYGVRRRRLDLGVKKPSLFGTPVRIGFTVYGQRFHYNQARESSIFAFQQDIPAFDQFASNDRLDYVSHSYGGSVFVEYPIRRISSHVRFTYSDDVSDFRPLTASTNYYYRAVHFLSFYGPNVLTGIRTGKLIPSFIHNTLDDPIQPTHGTLFSVSTAVAGGDVNAVEPRIEARYFRSGFKPGHVVGMRLLGRFLRGYGDKVAPPYDRYYTGGEDDLRGFDSWSISPIVYLPSSTTVNVLNADGSPRIQKQIIGGITTFTNVTMQIPSYQLVSTGGDTNVAMNLEYRIPIHRPFTVALFTDVGVNRLTLTDQLRISPVLVDRLSSQFLQPGLSGHPRTPPGTQPMRMSSGLELQVVVPRIKAPLRFYGAYNPLVYRGTMQPPMVIDRSFFPNAATYENAASIVNTPVPLRERRFMFRFSIGRTFGESR